MSKKLWFASVPSILFLTTMFVGSTFAWFTDFAVNSGNRVQSGDLAVGFASSETISDGNLSGTIQDLKLETNAVFNLGNAAQPGDSQERYLRIRNEGNIAINYQVEFDVTVDSRLAEVIDFEIQPLGGSTTTVVGTNIDQGIYITLQDNVRGEGGLLRVSPDVPQEYEIWRVKMIYTSRADNTYNDASLVFEVDINLNAWQLNYQESQGSITSQPSSSSTNESSSSPSSQQNVQLNFNSKGGSLVNPITVPVNGITNAPTTPTRSGYRFGGWFRGRAGLTWLDSEAVNFPLTIEENTTLHAYWEPINSKSIDYSQNETYYASLNSSTRLLLNPMKYEFSIEKAQMDNLSTPLYTTEVDWDHAIAQGIAKYVGDFSMIENNEHGIDEILSITVLHGAAAFPKDAEGISHTINGKLDSQKVNMVTSMEWTFELREDVFFEDGLQVTAGTYEYTLKQFLDPVQNNFRAGNYFRDEINRSGLPILNASQYFKQTSDNPVPWSNVGFEIINDFSFKLKTHTPISQQSAINFGNMQLVHPTVFEESFTGGANSNYGTPANPFRSYGPYVIKSWIENQRLVLNKNFDFIRKETINYKSIDYAFTATEEENMNLFAEGLMSTVGLGSQFYSQYAENPNVKREWSGFPQYLVINTSPSTLSSNPYQKHPIVQDPRFRQALFFGFNREAYNSTIHAPNTPSVLPVPVDTKAYNQDQLYYSESPNHLENLEHFDITPESNGFIPERAIALFNAALTDYLASPNALNGPVSLKLAITDSPLNLSLANFIKFMYEDLFNTDPTDPDKLIVNVVAVSSANPGAIFSSGDFDIRLVSLGFGVSQGVFWQFAAIGILGGTIGSQFGLTIPFTGGLDENGNTVRVDLREDPESWLMENITVDLKKTYDYLVELGEDYIFEQELINDNLVYVRPGYVWLYEELKASSIKDAGLYVGSVYFLANYVYNSTTPWDGAAAEPFLGATEEMWKLTAAFEKVFLEQLPLIPTSSLSTAILYAENVKFIWPTYSVSFKWGSSQYRYLNTDPDFADGFYNSYQNQFNNLND